MMKRFVLGLTAVALLLSGGARARAEYIVTDLGTLGGHASSAVGINDAGQVVGTAFTSNGAYHAYLYSNGVMIDVNPPGNNSFGNGINASGQVVGYTGGAPSGSCTAMGKRPRSAGSCPPPSMPPARW